MLPSTVQNSTACCSHNTFVDQHTVPGWQQTSSNSTGHNFVHDEANVCRPSSSAHSNKSRHHRPFTDQHVSLARKLPKVKSEFEEDTIVCASIIEPTRMEEDKFAYQALDREDDTMMPPPFWSVQDMPRHHNSFNDRLSGLTCKLQDAPSEFADGVVVCIPVIEPTHTEEEEEFACQLLDNEDTATPPHLPPQSPPESQPPSPPPPPPYALVQGDTPRHRYSFSNRRTALACEIHEAEYESTSDDSEWFEAPEWDDQQWEDDVLDAENEKENDEWDEEDHEFDSESLPEIELDCEQEE